MAMMLFYPGLIVTKSYFLLFSLMQKYSKQADHPINHIKARNACVSFPRSFWALLLLRCLFNICGCIFGVEFSLCFIHRCRLCFSPGCRLYSSPCLLYTSPSPRDGLLS